MHKPPFGRIGRFPCERLDDVTATRLGVVGEMLGRRKPMMVAVPRTPLEIAYTVIDAGGGSASAEALIRAGLTLVECMRLQESKRFDTSQDELGTIFFSRKHQEPDILEIVKKYGPETDVITLLAEGLTEKQIHSLEDLGLMRVIRSSKIGVESSRGPWMQALYAE